METPTILIVDDDPDDQEMLEEAIREISPHIECISFLSGLKAIAHIKSNKRIHLVFLDLNMPIFGGLDFLKTVKAEIPEFTAPIFIYSTSSEERDKTNSLNAGATGYIVKPSRYSTLLENIEKIFKNYLN